MHTLLVPVTEEFFLSIMVGLSHLRSQREGLGKPAIFRWSVQKNQERPNPTSMKLSLPAPALHVINAKFLASKASRNYLPGKDMGKD